MTITEESLAVNLSDLATMGAYPLGFTLGLGLNALNSSWLLAFSRGLFEVSRNYKCELLGGDTIKISPVIIFSPLQQLVYRG